MTFLLGRHAMLGHEPPISPFSTTATRCPDRANSQAMYLPASPPPKTTFWKRSRLLIRLSSSSTGPAWLNMAKWNDARFRLSLDLFCTPVVRFSIALGASVQDRVVRDIDAFGQI